MKIAAYVLFILQAISFAGNAMNGGIGQMIAIWFGSGVYGISACIGFFLPTILGFILLGRHKKRVAKRTNVMFYCPRCKAEPHVGTPNLPQGCPICHKPAKQSDVLHMNWMKMSDAEKEAVKNRWWGEE